MDSLELVQVRLMPDKKLYSETPIRNAEDACRVLADEMKTLDRETIAVMSLNAQNQIISACFCSIGSLQKSMVVPREIYKSCILQNAASCILAHNHPSGPSTKSKQYFLPDGSVYESWIHPSEQDINVTKWMIACGELLGIELLDHVIVAGYSGEFFSFRKSGLMSQNELGQYMMSRNVSMPMEADNKRNNATWKKMRRK